MAKRTAALVVAWTILLAGVAGAEQCPVWPCEVTVSIEAGPWHAAAVGAVAQLDAATSLSWPIVESGAMVTIGWAEMEIPNAALASVSANDVEKVGGTVEVDPDVPNRWAMTALLHELGHVAGLDHNDEGRSVMNPGLGDGVPWRRFQAVDLDLLSRVECHG